MDFREIEQLELNNRSVFLRLDLNVPMKNGVITDDTRIREALPTLRYILERTHKVVVASHLGRPKDDKDKNYSLDPVGIRLAELLNKEIAFVTDYRDKPIDQLLLQLEKNQFILLENLRFFPEETQNDEAFSQTLAKGIDFYISDAFGAIHRKHASVVGVPEKIPQQRRAIGLLMKKEIVALDKLKNEHKAPFTVIIGGAKVSDKMSVILNLLNHCNHLLIGGAMAYTFLKYQGIDVGSSLVEHDKLDLVASIYRNAEARRVSIHLPCDHVCGETFSQETEAQIFEEAIPKGFMGLDIGPKTIENFKNIIASSQTIFWNGPLGVFEWSKFRNGTLAVAEAIAESRSYSVAGGGDSVAAINMARVADKFSHVSTGGGASLEYIEGKILPGLKVLSMD